MLNHTDLIQAVPLAIQQIASRSGRHSEHIADLVEQITVTPAGPSDRAYVRLALRGGPQLLVADYTADQLGLTGIDGLVETIMSLICAAPDEYSLRRYWVDIDVTYRDTQDNTRKFVRHVIRRASTADKAIDASDNYVRAMLSEIGPGVSFAEISFNTRPYRR